MRNHFPLALTSSQAAPDTCAVSCLVSTETLCCVPPVMEAQPPSASDAASMAISENSLDPFIVWPFFVVVVCGRSQIKQPGVS